MNVFVVQMTEQDSRSAQKNMVAAAYDLATALRQVEELASLKGWEPFDKEWQTNTDFFGFSYWVREYNEPQRQTICYLRITQVPVIVSGSEWKDILPDRYCEPEIPLRHPFEPTKEQAQRATALAVYAFGVAVLGEKLFLNETVSSLKDLRTHWGESIPEVNWEERTIHISFSHEEGTAWIRAAEGENIIFRIFANPDEKMVVGFEYDPVVFEDDEPIRNIHWALNRVMFFPDARKLVSQVPNLFGLLWSWDRLMDEKITDSLRAFQKGNYAGHEIELLLAKDQ